MNATELREELEAAERAVARSPHGQHYNGSAADPGLGDHVAVRTGNASDALEEVVYRVVGLRRDRRHRVLLDLERLSDLRSRRHVPIAECQLLCR